MPASAQEFGASTGPKTEVVGRLGGDDVAVKNGVDFETENGRTTAVVANGTDITVRSGEAKIDLVEGGDIEICGPAHLSLLKSAGAVTIALDYGLVHLQIGSAPTVMLYMPLIVATPVAIGSSSRDLTIGLDRQGKLCVGAVAGAVRIEQQMTGQSLMIPQGGRVSLMSTELNLLGTLASGECACEVMVSQNTAAPRVELSVPVRPSEKAPEPMPPPEPKPADRAVYRIDMPPLTFDAKSPAPPPDPDPAAMLLVRESHPEPEVIFKGGVEPAAPKPPAPLEDVSVALPLTTTAPPKKPGFFARIFGIFHRRAAACAGSNCGVDKT